MVIMIDGAGPSCVDVNVGVTPRYSDPLQTQKRSTGEIPAAFPATSTEKNRVIGGNWGGHETFSDAYNSPVDMTHP
jgi:hypothetical protein